MAWVSGSWELPAASGLVDVSGRVSVPADAAPGTYQTGYRGYGAVDISSYWLVTVLDCSTPVTVGSVAPIEVPATGPSGAAVTYTPPTATDVYGETLPVSCVPASGSPFAVGATTVTCTATEDPTGDDLSGSSSFVVTVDPYVSPKPTAASVCAATSSDVDGSAAYAKLPAKSKTAVEKTVSGLCSADLNAVAKAKPGLAKALLVAAYKLGIAALQASGYLTKAQVADLLNQVAQL